MQDTLHGLLRVIQISGNRGKATGDYVRALLGESESAGTGFWGGATGGAGDCRPGSGQSGQWVE